MFAELHLIQNFAPSCLNRDDTNSPKECMFGGYRRARVSSQCFKRSIRQSQEFAASVASDHLAKRTRLLGARIVDALVERGHGREGATAVVGAVLDGLGFKQEAGKTAVLLFVSPAEEKALLHAIDEAFDELAKAVPAPTEGEKAKKPKKGKAKGLELPRSVATAITGGGTTTAADIALFGRMIAEGKNLNVDAACQVAHAISTHAVQSEMDFFTAVDDLNPKEDTGAGMMGIVEFNSACLYRYAAVDLNQLRRNLGGDVELTLAALEGFLNGSFFAIPTGKQNSMAAFNLPSFALGIVRDGAPRTSLVNAFQQPVRPTGAAPDIVRQSAQLLLKHEEELANMYGLTAPDHRAIAAMVDVDASTVPVADLVAGMVGVARGRLEGAAS